MHHPFHSNAPAQNQFRAVAGHAGYVVLGASGDVCIMLPLFHDIFLKTKQKPVVIVSKTYAGVFDGVSYVDAVVYDQPYDRNDKQSCRKIADFARQKVQDRPLVFLNPVETMNGIVPQETDSFVKEFWRIAGRPHEWGMLPLVFDLRDPEREKKLIESLNFNDKPLILAALTGLTSPFPQKGELMTLLQTRFTDFQIIDLFNVKAERIYDLLGLFDRAKLLITVDTAHLHLSRASDVPVIAIARDYPAKWNGSPWHKRFRFYCRYGEYDARREELLQTVKNVTEDVPRVFTKPVDKLSQGGYNGSIIRFNGKILMSYRHHWNKSHQTRLAMATLDENSNVVDNRDIQFPQELMKYGLEDGRLFIYRGELWISYTASVFPTMPAKCVMQYAKLIFSDGNWIVGKHFQPKYPGNDFSTLQKNWTPFVNFDELYFIYGVAGDNQIVLQVDGDEVLPTQYSSPRPQWAYGDIRGGVVLPYKDGKLIRFFHSRTHNGQKYEWWRYHVGAAIMEGIPPFKTLAVSKNPILSGHEYKAWDCFHAKHNVIIVYGAIAKGDGWLISCGLNDCVVTLSEVSERQLNF